MRTSLALIAALVVFDLGVAVLVSLALLAPSAAAGLLLTNPIALVVEHQLRGRRGGIRLRRRD